MSQGKGRGAGIGSGKVSIRQEHGLVRTASDTIPQDFFGLRRPHRQNDNLSIFPLGGLFLSKIGKGKSVKVQGIEYTV